MGISNPFIQGYEGYVATDTVIDDHLTEYSLTLAYTKRAEFRVVSSLSPASTLRFKIDLYSYGGVYPVYADFRINGVSVWETWHQAGYLTKTHDTTTRVWNVDDIISVWTKIVGGGAGGLSKTKNIKICGDKRPLIEV